MIKVLTIFIIFILNTNVEIVKLKLYMLNKQFSNDINALNSAKLFSSETLEKLQGLVSDSVISKLKKFKANDFQIAVNRQTCTIDELVNKNIRLALKEANYYFENTGAKRKGKCELDDVVQAANMGLVIAATKYIETKDGEYSDYSFAPFAKRWIKKYTLDFINYGCNPIKFTNDDAHTVQPTLRLYSIDATFSSGSDELQSPILNELRTELEPDTLREIKSNIEIRERLLTKLLSILEQDELRVINALFGLDSDNGECMTIPEANKALKLTKFRIEELHSSAIQKLRDGALSTEEISQLLDTSALVMPKDEFFIMYKDQIDLSDWDIEIETNSVEQNTKLHKALDGLVSTDILVWSLSKTNIQSISENISVLAYDISDYIDVSKSIKENSTVLV